MIAKSKKEIEILEEGGKILATILSKISKLVKPGINGKELDDKAYQFILFYGGAPSFKGYTSEESYTPFPASLCVSVNDEVVHGIPDEKKNLKEGDLASLDLGIKWPAKNGLYTDAAITVPVGNIDSAAFRLLNTGKKALEIGISRIKSGGHIGDIGESVFNFVESQGFKIAENLVGHGVGRRVHEDPYIPNIGVAGSGPKIKKNQVLAFEPMINEKGSKVVLDKNGWTWRTFDKSRSVHFEHSVVATTKGPKILTIL